MVERSRPSDPRIEVDSTMLEWLPTGADGAVHARPSDILRARAGRRVCVIGRDAAPVEEPSRDTRYTVVSTSSEWDLIDQCRRGRTRAFEPLVIGYQGEAMAMATALLLNPDDAADAVQDAFVRAYRGLGKLATGSAFGPWFRMIVRNTCLDRLRARRRRNHVPIHEATSEELGLDPVGTTRIEREQLSASVWTALLTLSEAHRQALVLKEIEGLGYAEIARVLGIPDGTVASRVYHARAALKRALQTNGIGSNEGEQ